MRETGKHGNREAETKRDEERQRLTSKRKKEREKQRKTKKERKNNLSKAVLAPKFCISNFRKISFIK